MRGCRPVVVAFAVLVFLAVAVASSAVTFDQALAESKVKGGLCVIVGNCEADLAVSIAQKDPYLVHCLFADASKVDTVREALFAQKMYGRVSVEEWKSSLLPYADNLVSLLLVVGKSPDAVEMMRVLRPGGELIVKQGENAAVKTKPFPQGMDDWTHWRRSADRNPVSKDSIVDVPDRIQWLFTTKTVGERCQFVTSNGRAFTQDGDKLIARDAFNGIPLWQAKLKVGADYNWEYSVKVSALIVAVKDRVYCIADDGKLKALDAATGTPAVTYEATEPPFDIILVEDGKTKLGTLVLGCKTSVQALDAATGKLLWNQTSSWPAALMGNSSGIYYIEGNDRHDEKSRIGTILGRDLATGKLLWKKSYDWARRTEQGSLAYDRIAYEMRSPNNWRDFYAANPDQKKKDNYNIAVISAKTGEEIQRVTGTGSSSRHGEFRCAFWYKEHLLTECNTREGLSLALFDLTDLSKPSETFKANFVGDRGWGHCYPPVLTDRYYLNGQLNFTDISAKKQVSNQITRGACNTARSGYIPANGMVYTFPKHCICFPMLDGNVALAPAYVTKPAETTELVRGPAWQPTRAKVDYSKEWPAFRHDEYRSAGVKAEIPTALTVAWTADLPGVDYKQGQAVEWTSNAYLSGPVTPPVSAGGLVYVAQSDTHKLIALDAATGKERWHFIANGRIDGPPTIYNGMCIFGCRSGWVYSLQAADGKLIYRLRVAPYERRISVFGQVESPWPVPGSVLVTDGLAYVAAGIHPNSDGGIRVVCFKPETGDVVWKNKFSDMGFNDVWPDPYDPRKTRPDSDMWRCVRPLEYHYFDLPVRDGDSVAVSRCLFDLKTGKVNLQKTSGYYQIKGTGVYMPRASWRYGTERAGSPLAASLGSSVYGCLAAASKLVRADFVLAKKFDTDWVKVTSQEEGAGFSSAVYKIPTAGQKWETPTTESKTTFNRAILVAGTRVVTASPKGLLSFYDANTGKKLAETQQEPTAWDGLALAGGRLFVTTASGKVICLAAK